MSILPARPDSKGSPSTLASAERHDVASQGPVSVAAAHSHAIFNRLHPAWNCKLANFGFGHLAVARALAPTVSNRCKTEFPRSPFDKSPSADSHLNAEPAPAGMSDPQ
ncbi:hypothetical protein [Roseateles sp. P5_E11]